MLRDEKTLRRAAREIEALFEDIEDAPERFDALMGKLAELHGNAWEAGYDQGGGEADIEDDYEDCSSEYDRGFEDGKQEARDSW